MTGETVDLGQACCPAGGTADQKDATEGAEKDKRDEEKVRFQ